MSLTPKGYALVGIAVLGIGGYVGKSMYDKGEFGKIATVTAAVPTKTHFDQFAVGDLKATYTLPANAVPSKLASCPVMEVLAWNAESSIILANGGANTARGSFVEKYSGGCLTIKRQDDYGQMEANLAKFISSNGQNGDAFFIIMGDAMPYVASALNNLGLQGQYSVIGAIGFSDGEDQAMLPSNWRTMMKDGKPILIAAVPRDGDWNIFAKFAADNGIKMNVDQKTIDPTAFNFVDVNMFTDADEKLISKATEERTLVTGGVEHGKISVQVNGVATWTPGDKAVVEKYDGSITGVASTAEYKGQMPAIIIAAKKLANGTDWLKDNHDYIVGLLKASDRGAFAIRKNGAYDIMDAANQDVFQDKGMNPGDWAQYYKGMSGVNKAGERVRLGGSKVVTLQEARDYFGLKTGNLDTYKVVYSTFKGYDENFYPDLYPKSGSKSIPAYEDIMDLSYMQDALKDVPTDAPKMEINLARLEQAPISRVVSKKAVHIEFDTGKATIKAESIPVLNDILASAAISSGLRMQVDGYTDNSGSDTVNIPLSKARAQAVVAYLHNKAPLTFPNDNFDVAGYGSQKPVCVEPTAECRAQNRRVEITQGN